MDDLTLAPITIKVDETKDAKGQCDGYSLEIKLPIPTTSTYARTTEGIGVLDTYVGKRALRQGPEKIKRKGLKILLSQVKALKDFWTFRYREIRTLMKESTIKSDNPSK